MRPMPASICSESSLLISGHVETDVLSCIMSAGLAGEGAGGEEGREVGVMRVGEKEVGGRWRGVWRQC